MTVTTVDPSGNPVTRSGPYLGNGVATVFDYDFPVYETAELEPVRRNADGTETILTTGFTVTGVGDPNGGTVVLAAPLATGTQLILRYRGSFRQPTDYSNQGAISLEVLERSLDRITMTQRQLLEVVDRAVTVDSFGATDIEVLRANINALAALSSELAAIAGALTEIEDVAAQATAIAAVGGALAAITGVQAALAPITAVSGAIPELEALAPVAAELAALADALEYADVVGDSLAIVGEEPRVILRDTAGAPSGAEQADFHLNTGVLSTRARSAADAAVATLAQIAFDATGATEHRWFGTGGGLIARLSAAGLFRATRLQYDAPSNVGTAHAITRSNDIVRGGPYYCDATDVDNPVAVFGRSVYLQHLVRGDDATPPVPCAQIAVDDSTFQGTIYVRVDQGAGFSPWASFEGYRQVFVATPSGANAEFPTLPNGIDSFRVLHSYSLSASATVLMQLRTSPGGLVSAGYAGSRSVYASTAQIAAADAATGFTLLSDGAAGTVRAVTEFRKFGTGGVWQARTSGYRPSDNGMFHQIGELSGLVNPVSGLRLTPSAGAFNGGGFYVEWGQ